MNGIKLNIDEETINFLLHESNKISDSLVCLK